MIRTTLSNLSQLFKIKAMPISSLRLVSTPSLCKLLQESSSSLKAMQRAWPRPRSKVARLAQSLTPLLMARIYRTRLSRSESTAPISKEILFCLTRHRTWPLPKSQIPPNSFHPSAVQTSTKCRTACNLSQFRASRFHIQDILRRSRLSKATARF